jgi:hypothetical protein
VLIRAQYVTGARFRAFLPLPPSPLLFAIGPSSK